jgi:hypothetical protein
MKVILLGAGASKSYSASLSKVRMPIAKDFFQTFRKLSISENTWVLIGNIINYLKKYHHISDFEEFDKYNKDIEEIHSEIELRLKGYLDDKAESREVTEGTRICFKAYTELIFLFSSVINEVQNGPVSGAHLNLVSRLKANDVIITFNWDTLVDRALSTSKNWDCFTGYFVKPLAVYKDDWVGNNSNAKETNAPLLLKLHGSTNWLTSAPIVEGKNWQSIQELSNDHFFIYESTVKPYATYDGRYMNGYDDFSYGYYPVNLPLKGVDLPEGYFLTRAILRTSYNPKGESSDKGLISIPLIIPPVKNKNYDYFGSLFDSLWNKAEESLAKADEIVIIGYSFPVTDFKTDLLFRQAFIKRKTFPIITIIDPNPEQVEERFLLDYGIPKEKLNVIKDYFSEDFDLSGII